MRKTEKNGSVSNEQFVKAWQSMDSAVAVAEKFGMSAQWARMKACNLRKRGVDLKMMQRGCGIVVDHKALSRLAKKYSK